MKEYKNLSEYFDEVAAQNGVAYACVPSNDDYTTKILVRLYDKETKEIVEVT
jgi:hypothetical protein